MDGISVQVNAGHQRRKGGVTGTSEVLQVPKHLYKQEHLDFTSHWIVKEEDYSIEKVTEAVTARDLDSPM